MASLPTPSETSSPGTHPFPTPYAVVETVFETESTGRRLMELTLLHHYLVFTAETFLAEDNQRVHDTWTKHVPRHATEHPALLNALLSLSALHIVNEARRGNTFAPPDLPQCSLPTVKSAKGKVLDWADAHQSYLNLAVRQQRDCLSNLGPHNVDAVCLASIAISFQSFALLTIADDVDGYAPPMQWLGLSSAIATVLEAAEPILPSNSIIPSMVMDKPDVRSRSELFHPRLRRYFNEGLLDFQAFPEPDAGPMIQCCYEDTLSYIGSIHASILAKESDGLLARRLWAFAPKAPVIFAELVGKRRPRALAILAHFFALTKEVEHIWWFAGTADREVRGIQSILPSDWQWALVSGPPCLVSIEGR